jgi:hypothetical protein
MGDKYNSDMKTMQEMLAATQTRYQDRDAYRMLSDLQREINEIKSVFGGQLASLIEQHQEVKSRLDLLTEAIAVSHIKNDEGNCTKDCLGCHIIDVMKGLQAARKLMDSK